jgi:hypothetical protein
MGLQIKELQGLFDALDDRVQKATDVAEEARRLAKTVKTGEVKEVRQTRELADVPTSPHAPTPPVNVVVPNLYDQSGYDEGPLPPLPVIEPQVVQPVVQKKKITLDPVEAAKAKLPRLANAPARREFDLLRSDVRRLEEFGPHIKDHDQTITALKGAIEQLNKTVKSMLEVKADKSELQGLFEQFRMAMGELNNRLATVRKLVSNKADSIELQDLQKALLKELAQSGETAAGTEQLRCLLCGRPRTMAGAIDDPELIKALGPGCSTRVTSVDGTLGTACFVYGDHGEVFFGRSPDGKPILGTARGEDKPPQTAPASVRKPVQQQIDASDLH